MPPTFQLPLVSLGVSRGDTEVWIPLDPSPPDANRGSGNTVAYARRKPGVSLEQAKADARRVATAIAAIDPARYQNYTAGVADLREATIGMVGATVRAPLLILLGGAGLLLLIACANVATLLLARSVVRARETAIRVALGASRRQLALRYFAEGALVSVAGAAAGVGLSVILVRHILAAASGFIPRVDDIAHRLDGARLQRGGGGRHRRARRPGAALAGDAHGAERGALRRRSRISRGACATPVEGVRRRRNRARLHAPDDVGHSRRSHAQSRTRVVGLRPRRPRRVQPRPAERRRRNQ